MRASAIPDDVRRFILFAIPSVPYLEALLLMRLAPEASWNAGQVARRLYLGEKEAAAPLQQLDASGVIARAGDVYRYRPVNPDLADLLDALSQAYSRHLIEITQLIHSTRNEASRKFADAFLLGKHR